MNRLACALLSLSILFEQTHFASADSHSHSAVRPLPRNDQWWKDRAKLLDDRLRQTRDTQLLFIGDSITQGWEGEGKNVWEKHFAPRKAVNLGIGGDRTQHVLWRLENAPLDGVKPKAAVLMIGTNNSNGEDNTPQQIAQGVRAIVAKLRERLPETKILLLGIFPRGENFNAQRGKLAQINQVLAKLHDGKDVRFLDIGHRFLDSDGLLPAGIMPDYLHLSEGGYQIWAEAIEAPLRRLLGEAGSSAAAAADITGEWTWKIRDQDGVDHEAPLKLNSKAGKVTGRFARDAERWLEIQDGQISGHEFHWTVKRDRPNGDIIVYKMTGSLGADGTIKGKVTTTLEGTEVTSDWSARRN